MIHKHDILAIDNDRLRRQATMASVTVATILIVAKLAGYIATGSVSMLTSLFDSIFDLIASVVTAFGVASALRPPDHDHRYGHGKAEPLAALAQAIFIIASSLLLIYQAGDRLYHPREIENELIGYGVMALAIALTVALVWFQHHVIHHTHSLAIGADRLHYVGDLAVNLAVVAAFALHHFTGLNWFDALFAFGISCGLLVSAFQILKQALGSLMDAELPPAEREKIAAIVRRQPGVRGMHDMRTRSDSDRIFIDMHVEMDGAMSLIDAHLLSEKIAAAVRADFPHADITIHQDPAGLVEERRDMQIEKRWG